MKGPGLRIRHDVRRRWICPETGNILKTPGTITHLYSPFVKRPCWMKLTEEKVFARPQLPLQVILEKMIIEETEEIQTEPETTEPAPEIPAEPESTRENQTAQDQPEENPATQNPEEPEKQPERASEEEQSE